MKTSAIEVRDMLSVLSVQGVEERIGEVPSVESVTVNFSAGTATVRYDETRLDISDIKSDVRQRGYADTDTDTDTDADADADAATPASSAATPQTAAPKTTSGKPAEIASSSPEASAAMDAKPPDKTTQTMAAPPVAKAEAPDKTTSDAGEKMPMPEKG